MNGCLNPQLIYNKTALKILKVRPYIYTPDGIRNVRLDSQLRLPSDLRLRPRYNTDGTIDFPAENDLSDLYSVQNFDGTCESLYNVVPCGKCKLCKLQLRNAWACRAVVEANSSHFVPLFVTLTYNPEHLPAEGVNKRDVQLFLKRLRKRLSTRYPKFCNKKYCLENGREFLSLRYLGCSEYGKKGRAHYHLMLFNVPYINNYTSLNLIEECWNNGFVYVVPSNSGSCRYITKYMCKPTNVPEGQNKCFFMCSRGRGDVAGIGSQYLNNNSLPIDATYIELVDYWSDDKTPHKYAIPQYYKQKYWPSISKMVTPRTSALLTELNSKCLELAVLRGAARSVSLTDSNFNFESDFNAAEIAISEVSKLYPWAPLYVPCVSDVQSNIERLCRKYHRHTVQRTDSDRFPKLERYQQTNHIFDVTTGKEYDENVTYVDWLKYDCLENISFIYDLVFWLTEDAKQYNIQFIEENLSARSKRADYLKQVVKNLPDTNEIKLEKLNKELTHYEQISKVD